MAKVCIFCGAAKGNLPCHGLGSRDYVNASPSSPLRKARSMRRSIIAAALSLAVAGSSLIALPAAQAAGPLPEPTFGMHVPTISIGTDPGVTYGSIRLWDSGITWGQVEQKKNFYWWNGMDAAIGNANSQNAQILYVLGGTPTWAATNKKQGTYPNKGAASVPKMKDWKSWVNAVTKRYGDSIESYQIWNEADLTNFWAGTPKQMADLTKAAAKIIRKNDPTAKIVSASSTVRLASSYKRFFPAYLKALKKAKWPVDVIAVHTYPDGKGNPGTRVDYIEKVQKDMKKAKVPASKGLWDTEVNYGIRGPGKVKGQSITGAQAASWVAQTYLDNILLGVERSYWYYWAPANNLIGITLQDGTTGAVGYQTVNQWLAGSYYTCGTVSGTNVCQLGNNDNPEAIAWVSQGSGTYTVPANATVQCDALNNCSAVTPGTQVTIGNMPLWFGTPAGQAANLQ